MTQLSNSVKVSTLIDARSPRFGAAITTVVLAAALATSNVWFIVVQALIFAIGAFKGPQYTPYAFIYKKAVKPFLKGEVPVEEVKPPQFAQKVGLLFALVAIVGALLGIEALVIGAVSMALGAAFLNATFNFCLGCEIYLLLLRARSK
jgi:hypothetical protein